MSSRFRTPAKDKRDKLEALQVLLRHIRAVKYRTKNKCREEEFMGIHKNVNSSHDKIIFYMTFYLGICHPSHCYR